MLRYSDLQIFFIIVLKSYVKQKDAGQYHRGRSILLIIWFSKFKIAFLKFKQSIYILRYFCVTRIYFILRLCTASQQSVRALARAQPHHHQLSYTTHFTLHTIPCMNTWKNSYQGKSLKTSSNMKTSSFSLRVMRRVRYLLDVVMLLLLLLLYLGGDCLLKWGINK